LGLMIDRHHRMRLLLALGVAWTVGLAMAGWANGVSMLFAAKMLSSLGANCSIAVVISIAADLCSPARRGTAMLILTLGKWGGTASAFALGGWMVGKLAADGVPAWLGDIAPWRGVHLLLALGSAILIMPLLLFLREPQRRETVAAAGAPFGVVMRELWVRRRFLLPLFIGQISVAMVDTAAGIWAAPILSRNYGLQPHQFANWMGAVIFGAGVLGAILGGIAADAGHKLKRRGGILIGAVVMSGLAIPAALFPIAPDTTIFAIALFFFLLCGTTAGLIVSATLATLLPNELRGLCLGLFIAIAGVISFGIAPTLITLVSALLGGETHLATALAMVGIIVSALAFVAFPFAMRRAPRTATEEPF
ncbi:MAG: MFS transporter, partial [Rhizorhabdus sp.]